MRLLSTKRERADKHPLETPRDLVLMFIVVPGAVLLSLLVWAA